MDRHVVHNRFLRVIPAMLWMLGIFALSSQSRIPQAPGLSIQVMAVLGHLAAYGVLAVLIGWGAGLDSGRFSPRLLLVWALTVLYGISDEFHQSFVPGRYATVEDVIIDAVGAGAGLTAMYLVTRWRRDKVTV